MAANARLRFYPHQYKILNALNILASLMFWCVTDFRTLRYCDSWQDILSYILKVITDDEVNPFPTWYSYTNDITELKAKDEQLGSKTIGAAIGINLPYYGYSAEASG